MYSSPRLFGEWNGVIEDPFALQWVRPMGLHDEQTAGDWRELFITLRKEKALPTSPLKIKFIYTRPLVFCQVQSASGDASGCPTNRDSRSKKMQTDREEVKNWALPALIPDILKATRHPHPRASPTPHPKGTRYPGEGAWRIPFPRRGEGLR